MAFGAIIAGILGIGTGMYNQSQASKAAAESRAAGALGARQRRAQGATEIGTLEQRIALSGVEATGDVRGSNIAISEPSAKFDPLGFIPGFSPVKFEGGGDIVISDPDTPAVAGTEPFFGGSLAGTAFVAASLPVSGAFAATGLIDKITGKPSSGAGRSYLGDDTAAILLSTSKDAITIDAELIARNAKSLADRYRAEQISGGASTLGAGFELADYFIGD